MDKIITGFKELAEEAGFSADVFDRHDGMLLNFAVYSEHEDFGEIIIDAVADKDSNGWQLFCTAYEEDEAIYQSSGICEGLDIKGVPAQLLKVTREVLELVRSDIERVEIKTSQNRSEASENEGSGFGMSVFGKDVTVSINPEFMKITDLTEEEMLKAVFDSLKEMDEDDLMFAFEDMDVDGIADSISTRVRNSYSSYCVSPTECGCGGNNDLCNQCFGFGEYGNIYEEPLLVVVGTTLKSQFLRRPRL